MPNLWRPDWYGVPWNYVVSNHGQEAALLPQNNGESDEVGCGNQGQI